MASPPTSSLRFVTLDGVPLPEPVEWTPCFIELGVPAALLTDVVVERNDTALTVAVRELDGDVRVLAEWPRSPTGRYDVAFWCAPAGINERATATVRPAKLSERAYSKLLEDLELRLPASIAVGLSTHGALAGIQLLPPAESTLEQELLRVRRAVRGQVGRPGLAAALRRVAEDPYRSLVGTELWVQRERARRLDPTRLGQLLTRAGNLTSDGRPRRVPEIRVEETVDVYENRLVRAFYDQVSHRIRLLGDATSPNAVASGELASLHADLVGARRSADFLDDVGQLVRAPAEVTMVLLKRPEYRAILEGWLEFRRSSVVRLDEPSLDAPLKNLPQLYETWGVLRLIDVVLSQAGSHGFDLRSERIAVRHTSGLFIRVLKDGKPALTFEDAQGNVLRVTPQRRYGKSGELRSISFNQVPDVVLELERSDGSVDIWLFDPKYKLDSEDAKADAPPGGAPVKTDIDAMHAYRDAIRDQAGTARVRYAAILYPGPSVAYSNGLAAIRAHPLGDSELRRHLVDVVRRCMTSAVTIQA
jgi:predicted component of viral defense system (DUF524 family)